MTFAFQSLTLSHPRALCFQVHPDLDRYKLGQSRCPELEAPYPFDLTQKCTWVDHQAF